MTVQLREKTAEWVGLMSTIAFALEPARDYGKLHQEEIQARVAAQQRLLNTVNRLAKRLANTTRSPPFGNKGVVAAGVDTADAASSAIDAHSAVQDARSPSVDHGPSLTRDATPQHTCLGRLAPLRSLPELIRLLPMIYSSFGALVIAICIRLHRRRFLLTKSIDRVHSPRYLTVRLPHLAIISPGMISDCLRIRLSPPMQRI
jgi:hypothetical protein